MENSLPLVMVVDGDEIHREILENMLEDDVMVISLASVEECMNALDYQKPDVIIIDPSNDSVQGFELISGIRRRLGEQACSIIVLTQDYSFNNRLRSYESGANDVLAKPFQPEELLVKINLNLNAKLFCKNLQTDAKDAMNAALSAMKQSSDLGLVLRFMEESISVQTDHDLAAVIHGYMKEFGVESCVMFVGGDEARYYYCDDTSPESLLMAMCKEKGRIVDVGLLTVINGSIVSILAREMPKDESRYGEIKDILGIVINLADARARSIQTLNELRKEKKYGVQASVKRGIEKINSMQAQLTQHTDALSLLMLSFRGRIGKSLFAIGASEDQEDMFLEMVDDSLEEMEAAFNGVLKLESEFKYLISELSSLADAAKDG